MKIKILLASSLLATLSFAGFAKGKGDSQTGELQIMSRSLMPSITTYMTPQSEIEILFYSNLEIVDVQIKNNIGTIVLKRTVDTSVQDNLQINISNLPTDMYQIEFRNSKGRVLKTEKFSTQ